MRSPYFEDDIESQGPDLLRQRTYLEIIQEADVAAEALTALDAQISRLQTEAESRRQDLKRLLNVLYLRLPDRNPLLISAGLNGPHWVLAKEGPGSHNGMAYLSRLAVPLPEANAES